MNATLPAPTNSIPEEEKRPVADDKIIKKKHAPAEPAPTKKSDFSEADDKVFHEVLQDVKENGNKFSVKSLLKLKGCDVTKNQPGLGINVKFLENLK